MIKNSQLRRNLSSTLWQLVHVEMEGDATLQAEEATAAVVLEDRPLLQIGRFAEEHQQVPVQKPAVSEWLVMTCLINVHKKS